MKERKWVVNSDSNTHIITFNGWLLQVDGRKVELPTSYYNKTTPIDFRLPIDGINCWCRYFPSWGEAVEIYVDDKFIKSDTGPVSPRKNNETEATIVLCVIAVIGTIFYFYFLLF